VVVRGFYINCPIDYIMETIQLISSISTPIIVLILGIIISRKIEDIKNKSIKKKEWSTKWSENFFHIFQGLNDTTENILFSLFEVSELNKSGKGNSPECNRIIDHINKLTSELQKKEFAIRTQMYLAPKRSKEFIDLLHKLFEQIREVFTSKTGNVEVIHDTLIELNRKAKLTHSEILELL